jgi:hypothetical protein
MKIAEMLVQQMEASQDFTKKNFGLAVGSAYPEIVRECLADERVALKLFMNAIRISLSGSKIYEALQNDEKESKGPSNMVSAEPIFYEAGMEFFYWGLQIGRMLEREEARALNALAREPQ